ncbi:unnamed protein product [Cuscuta epithymum]|uniref:Uncharacterized protein n=1 Tax=Cuscuta epithymum TaxID=186058 RepID=A0AAV0DBK9_9ASTE|nr:unnamed protein product [Cuscuta epithymum]
MVEHWLAVLVPFTSCKRKRKVQKQVKCDILSIVCAGIYMELLLTHEEWRKGVVY